MNIMNKKNKIKNDRDMSLGCGCKMHQFGFGNIVEWVVVKECGSQNCIYRKKLKASKK